MTDDVPKLFRSDLIERMAQAIEAADIDAAIETEVVEFKALAVAALYAIEDAGCVVVPMTPTREMLHATLLSSSHRSISIREKADIYRWMLKGSPFQHPAVDPNHLAELTGKEDKDG